MTTRTRTSNLTTNKVNTRRAHQLNLIRQSNLRLINSLNLRQNPRLLRRQSPILLTTTSHIRLILRPHNRIMIRMLNRIHQRRLHSRTSSINQPRTPTIRRRMFTQGRNLSSTNMNQKPTSTMLLRHLRRTNLKRPQQQLNRILINNSHNRQRSLTLTRHQRTTTLLIILLNLLITTLLMSNRRTQFSRNNTNNTRNITNTNHRISQRHLRRHQHRLTNSHTLPSRLMRTNLIKIRMKHSLLQHTRHEAQPSHLIHLLHILTLQLMSIQTLKRNLTTMTLTSRFTRFNRHINNRISQINTRMHSRTSLTLNTRHRTLMRTLHSTRHTHNQRTRLTHNLLLRHQNHRQQHQTTLTLLTHSLNSRRPTLHNLRSHLTHHIHQITITRHRLFSLTTFMTRRPHTRTLQKVIRINNRHPMLLTTRTFSLLLPLSSRTRHQQLRTPNQRPHLRLTPRRQQRIRTSRMIRHTPHLLHISRHTQSLTQVNSHVHSHLQHSLIRNRTISFLTNRRTPLTRSLSSIPTSHLTLTVGINHRPRHINLLHNTHSHISITLILISRIMTRHRTTVQVSHTLTQSRITSITMTHRRNRITARMLISHLHLHKQLSSRRISNRFKLPLTKVGEPHIQNLPFSIRNATHILSDGTYHRQIVVNPRPA